MESLENKKYYWMNLCILDDYQLAIEGDSFRRYYTSSAGQFYPNPQMLVAGNIIVQRKNKNTVTEITTGVEIPLVVLEIFKNAKGNTAYASYLEGDTSALAVAFGVIKTEDIPFEEDKSFALREATKEEIEQYSVYSSTTTWSEHLLDFVEGAVMRKQKYIRQHKEAKRQKKLDFARSLVRKKF